MADLDRYDLMEHPLRPFVKGWIKSIERSMEFKKEEFQNDADDIMQFFNGCKDDFWNPKYASGPRGYAKSGTGAPAPDFQMVLMKVAEGVQLFGPGLYSTDPIIEVDPRPAPNFGPEVFGIPVPQQPPPPQEGQPPQPPPPPDPQFLAFEQVMQQKGASDTTKKAASAVLAHLLNYNQRELDTKTHARDAIDEALIKGMGVRWTEVYYPPNSKRKMIQSCYDTVDRLALDPDAEKTEEVMWCARKRIMPVWKAEEIFELEPGTLDEYGTLESVQNQEFANTPDDNYNRKKGKSNDLIVYWDIYSKMGIGSKLTGVKKDFPDGFEMPDLGDYVYVAASDSCPFFLNLPPDILKKASKKQIFNKLQWPIPFWSDGKANGWPFTPLTFHRVPGHVWPMSHFKPGLGELKWLTWAMSFLANKVRTSCGTIIAVLQAAGEDLKNALKTNSDNKVVELQAILGRNINDIVSFLQQPEFHADIWKVVNAVFDLWDKRVGLSELLYGMSDTQDRSATETEVKQTNATSRINDMRAQVEGWATMVARKEAIAMRWTYGPEDVQEILGPIGTEVFRSFLASSEIDAVVREFDYGVVAGSTQLQDRQVKIRNLNEYLKNFGPVLANFASQGIVDPINGVMTTWGALYDTDVSSWIIQLPPQQPDPKIELEKQKLQAEIEQGQMDAQLQREKHEFEMEKARVELEMEIIKQQAELEMEAKKAEQEMQIERMKAEMELQIEREKAQVQLQLESQKAQNEMQLSEAQMNNEMQLSQTQMSNDMQLGQQKAASDLEVTRQQSNAKMEQVQQESQVKMQLGEQQAAQQQQQSQTEMQMAKEKHGAEMQMSKQKSQADLAAGKQKTAADVAATKAKAAAKPKREK